MSYITIEVKGHILKLNFDTMTVTVGSQDKIYNIKRDDNTWWSCNDNINADGWVKLIDTTKAIEYAYNNWLIDSILLAEDK